MFLIQQECTQYLLDCSILAFSLSITLWMVSSRMKCFCTHEFLKRFPELHHKMWVFVTHNCLGNSKTFYNIYKEQLCYLSCNKCLITNLTKYENCVFCKAVHKSENCVTSMREW